MTRSGVRLGLGLLAGAAILSAILLGGAGRAPGGVAPRAPLIGVDYTHYRYPSCGLDNGGIVARYGLPGVRTTVRRQLAAMRAAGIQTLRLLLWHVTDAGGMRWGIVSSGGGNLTAPVRSNLIHFLSDVRRAGFVDLTLAFAPEGNDDPLPPAPGNTWDPTRFAVNWSLVSHVRPLLKRYGPPTTRIDLLNEGAPPAWQTPDVIAQTQAYDAQMWSNYVTAFGGADASFSSVGADGPQDTSERLQNLIDALRASGKALPRWFDVHPPYDHDGMLAVLQAVDRTLTENGLSQPLVIGETAYGNAPVAAAIREFEATSQRRILEVMEWPLRAGRSCPPSPPFEARGYLRVLTGTGPRMRLNATSPGRHGVALRTAYGDPVTALEAGTYRVAVHDGSRRDGFRLVGPGVDERTSPRFRGHVSWKVGLRKGAYRYRSGRLRGSFVVLAAG